MIGRSRTPDPAPTTDAERLAALEEEVRVLRGARDVELAQVEAREALTLVGPRGHAQPSAFHQHAMEADAARVAARVAATESANAETERRREADAGPRRRLEEQIASVDERLVEARAGVVAAQSHVDDLERERGTAARHLGQREASYRVEPEPIPDDRAERDAINGVRPDDAHLWAGNA